MTPAQLAVVSTSARRGRRMVQGELAMGWPRSDDRAAPGSSPPRPSGPPVGLPAPSRQPPCKPSRFRLVSSVSVIVSSPSRSGSLASPRLHHALGPPPPRLGQRRLEPVGADALVLEGLEQLDLVVRGRLGDAPHSVP